MNGAVGVQSQGDVSTVTLGLFRTVAEGNKSASCTVAFPKQDSEVTRELIKDCRVR